MAVNCDSTLLASGSNDRTVIIWDIIGKLTIDSRITDATSALYHLAAGQTNIPLNFICPITHDIMRNPAIAEGKNHSRRIDECSLLNRISK